MFTGIISHLGNFQSVLQDSFTFSCDADLLKELDLGSSLAVNGVCLTIAQKTEAGFVVRVSSETLQRTMLGDLVAGEVVNLEQPLAVNDRLDGHIVQGHVDGVAELKAVQSDGASFILTISLPEDLAKYVVEKGSITVNGISLTVASLADGRFTLSIIPFTWEHTMVQYLKIGDRVNLEVDIIAKYVENLTKPYLKS